MVEPSRCIKASFCISEERHNFLKLEVLNEKFSWNCFNNNNIICFCHSLQVIYIPCMSILGLWWMRHDNCKFRLERTKCPNRSSDYTALWNYDIILLWEMYCQRPSNAKIENCEHCLLPFHTTAMRPLGYERVYLPFCKVANTLFYTQGGGGCIGIFSNPNSPYIYIFLWQAKAKLDGWCNNSLPVQTLHAQNLQICKFANDWSQFKQLLVNNSN